MDSLSTPPPAPIPPSSPAPDDSATSPSAVNEQPDVQNLSEAPNIAAVPSEQPEPAAQQPVAADDSAADQSFEISHDDHHVVKPQPTPQQPATDLSHEVQSESAPQPEQVSAPVVPVADVQSVVYAEQPQSQPPVAAELPAEPQVIPPAPAIIPTQTEAAAPIQASQQTEPQPQAITQPSDEPVDMFAQVSPESTALNNTTTPTPPNQPVSSFATPPPIDQSLQFVEQDPNVNPALVNNIYQNPSPNTSLPNNSYQPANLIQPVMQPEQNVSMPQNMPQSAADFNQSQPAVYSDPQFDQLAQAQNQPQSLLKSKKVKFILGAVGGLIILIIIGFIVKAQFFGNKLTAADITNTTSTLDKINSNISALEDDIANLTGANDVANIKKSYNDAQKQIKQANTNFDMLKKSRTLKYENVKPKYEAFETKWKTYVTFLNNNVNDINNLKPHIVALNDKLSSITQNTGDGTSTKALTNYINALNDGEKSIKKIDVKTKNIEIIQTGYEKYLDDTSSLCNKAIKSLKSGDDVAGLDCFLGTDKISKAYSTSLDKSAKQYVKQDSNLGVTDEMSALSGSISDLLPMVKS